MKDDYRKRIIFLLLLMMAVSLITGGASMYLLYGTAFEEQKKRLIGTAQSRSRLMEAVARFNLRYSSGYPKGPKAATVSQLRDAHRNFAGFGETGEFTLAELQGDRIVFLLSHRHYDLDFPKSVSMQSHLAEPMRRALSGLSGTVVGFDYRGEKVLAAYEFVKVLNLGIVAKIDITEIRAPFIKTGIELLFISLLFIGLGAILFLRVSEPLVKQLAVLAKFPNENPNPVIRVSDDCTVLYCNKAGEKLLDRIDSKSSGDWAGLKLPQPMQTEILKAMKKRGSSEFEFHAVSSNASHRTYNFLVSPIADNHSAYIYGIDVTERVELMNQLRLNTAVFLNTTEGVMICNENMSIQSVNPAFVEITGYRPEEILGKKLSFLNSGRHDRLFYKTVWDAVNDKGEWRGEIWNRRKNGQVYPQETTINTIVDDQGGIAWYASIFRDITKRKNAEDLLKHLSATDGLTGVANRRTFDETLEKEWSRALRSGKSFSIAMIDIDYFKQYNDAYGHQQGDMCLQEVACALSQCIHRPSDLLARYGGEEFVVILPTTDTDGAGKLAETMRCKVEALAMPHQDSQTASHVTVSIGLGIIHPAKGTPASKVVQLADEALYEAKHSGRNRVRIKSIPSHPFKQRYIPAKA